MMDDITVCNQQRGEWNTIGRYGWLASTRSADGGIAFRGLALLLAARIAPGVRPSFSGPVLASAGTGRRPAASNGGGHVARHRLYDRPSGDVSARG
jgi:hypothetical protein